MQKKKATHNILKFRKAKYIRYRFLLADFYWLISSTTSNREPNINQKHKKQTNKRAKY
jgi:hypothetical protein